MLARSLGQSHYFLCILGFLAFSTLFQWGCISVQLGGGKDTKPDFEFPQPQQTWEPIVGNANAFRSKHSGAVMGLGSACGRDAELPFDRLLETITASIAGHSVKVPVTELSGTLLPASYTEVDGVVDGNELTMLAIALKSDSCVYDVTLTGADLSTTERKTAIAYARQLRRTEAR